jgi:hypothetical protein
MNLNKELANEKYLLVDEDNEGNRITTGVDVEAIEQLIQKILAEKHETIKTRYEAAGVITPLEGLKLLFKLVNEELLGEEGK